MIAAVDHATFHHEADFLYYADVFDRIAGDGNDVGKIAGLEGANLILPTEELCAIEHVCLERCERGHAVLNHEKEFAGLRAVRKWTDVRANGHRDARRELPAKLSSVKILHSMFAFRRRR